MIKMISTDYTKSEDMAKGYNDGIEAGIRKVRNILEEDFKL